MRTNQLPNMMLKVLFLVAVDARRIVNHKQDPVETDAPDTTVAVENKGLFGTNTPLDRIANSIFGSSVASSVSSSGGQFEPRERAIPEPERREEEGRYDPDREAERNADEQPHEDHEEAHADPETTKAPTRQNPAPFGFPPLQQRRAPPPAAEAHDDAPKETPTAKPAKKSVLNAPSKSTPVAAPAHRAPKQAHHAAAGKPKACQPTCQWSCSNPRCEQQCHPMCAAPVCRTYCQPLKGSVEENGCHTICAEPKCTVICPHSCTSGNCPKCRTVCGAPVCKTKCNNECMTKCADPICNFQCQKPKECPKPVCAMSCNSVSDCLNTGKEPGNIGDSPEGYVPVTAGAVAEFGHGVGNILEAPKNTTSG